MILADLANGRIELFNTTSRERELVRMVPGTRWDAREKRWHAPLSWGSCVALRGVFGDQLEIGPDLQAWAMQERLTRVDPCNELRDKTEYEGDPALFPFQRAGAMFMATGRRVLLADEMGTGKTVQTIAALRILQAWGADPFPALVIAPNSMKHTWKREFEKWLPGVSVCIVQGTAAKRKKAIQENAQVTIINWESLRLHSRLASYGSLRLGPNEGKEKELNDRMYRTVIADEAHHMKNPAAKQTRAAWWIAHHGAEYRFALTGTPIANAPDDLWSLLHFLDADEWPSRTKYIDRYGLQSWNLWGGTSVIGIRPDTREEFFKIIDPRMRRMPKEWVLPQLPPRLYQQRVVEMGKKQADAYKSIRDNLIAELDTGILLATNPLAKLTRLIQFSSAYGEIDEENHLVLTEPSCKINELLEIADELGDEPFVVFAESRQLIDLAYDRLVKENVTCTKVTGEVTGDARDNAILDFQAGRVRAILVTLGAGSEGLTLTRAGHAIFLQRSWSMLKNKQAEARVHRIGSEQHDKILIIDVLAADTVEFSQLEAIGEKGERLEEILRDRDLMRRLLSE